MDWTTTRLNLRYHWKTALLWGLLLVGLLGCVLLGRAAAWVKGNQHFPDGEATVVVHRFCRSTFTSGCDAYPQARWQSIIRDVLTEWNEAGANWTFHMRPARRSDDPCNMRDAIPVVLATDDNLCPGDGRPRANVAGMVRGWPGRARVYVIANNPTSLSSSGVQRILLHEFGHVVGLGHPDEAGQNVVAVMNKSHTLTSLQPDDIAGIRALYGTQVGGTPLSALTGFLENPGQNSFRSGVGVISGWVCEAEEVTIEITTNRGRVLYFDAAYGTERTDTAGECGDTDNGFGLLFNWNRLGDGWHTVIALVDGEELERAQVTVRTLDGSEFVRGLSARYVLNNFPSPGEFVVIEWDEALQNFVIREKR